MSNVIAFAVGYVLGYTVPIPTIWKYITALAAYLLSLIKKS